MENTYILRPSHQRRFRVGPVREDIRGVLRGELTGKQYDPEEMPELTCTLANMIKDKLKAAGFERYKMVVQVVIGEQRGEGVKMGARCLWDADTDGYAEDIYVNDSLFCVAAVFGCFYY